MFYKTLASKMLFKYSILIWKGIPKSIAIQMHDVPNYVQFPVQDTSEKKKEKKTKNKI